MKKSSVISTEVKMTEVVANCDHLIANQIHTIRGVQVMLDRDLARLYEVEPKQLNRQVQRNAERFPEDFMFRLSKDEAADLKCQIGTSSWERLK